MFRSNGLMKTGFTKQLLIVAIDDTNSAMHTGWSNVPLSNKCAKEAIRVRTSIYANQLCPTLIYSSRLNRAIDFSNIIASAESPQLPIRTTWRFNERHFGALENISTKTYPHKMSSNFTESPPVLPNLDSTGKSYPIFSNCYLKMVEMGESGQNILDRMAPYYDYDILRTISQYQEFPIIITHRYPAHILMKHILKLSNKEFDRSCFPEKNYLLVQFNNENQYISHIRYKY